MGLRSCTADICYRCPWLSSQEFAPVVSDSTERVMVALCQLHGQIGCMWEPSEELEIGIWLQENELDFTVEEAIAHVQEAIENGTVDG